MFIATHEIAPTYISDVNGYDTRWSDMELYLPTLRKEAYPNSFIYIGGKPWNDFPEFVKQSTNIELFKRNYKIYKLIIGSWLIRHFRDFPGNFSVFEWCNDCSLFSG